jgi:diguanylate cyclase (GGDEF)-like protein
MQGTDVPQSAEVIVELHGNHWFAYTPSLPGHIATGKSRVEAQLTLQASLAARTILRDASPELPNRGDFLTCLNQSLLRAAQERRQVGILFIALDAFQELAGDFGQEVGEELLGAVGERLASSVRSFDSVARCGGEFALVLDGLLTPDDGHALAKRILGVFAQPFPVAERYADIRASAGLILSGVGSTGTASYLLASAELALREAKQLGPGSFVIRSAARSQSEDRTPLERHVERALERAQLSVFYQPTRSLAAITNTVAVEALVRWQHPSRGLVLPSDFVPVAERLGLMQSIDDWVFAEACRQVSRWRHDGAAVQELGLRVNLSEGQFRRQDLADHLLEISETAGLERGAITLEVPESLAVRDVEAASVGLSRLRAAGLRVALDSVGVAASPAQLRHFSVDGYNLDRTLIAELHDGTRLSSVIESMVRLAHLWGIEVTAEGIETDEQVLLLRDAGCDFGQGFQLGRPVDAASFSWLTPVSLQRP